MAFAPEVENDHLVIWYCTEKSLDFVLSPEISLVVEQPSLHDPDSLRVNVVHSAEHLCTDVVQILRIICRRSILVKCISTVKMVSTIQVHLLLDEHLSDLSEQFLTWIKDRHLREIDPFCSSHLGIRELFLERRRYVSCKGRKNRCHSKRALCSKNLLLKLFMIIHEALWKRSAPTVQITHPEPVEVCRATEEACEIFVGEAEFLIYPLPY